MAALSNAERQRAYRARARRHVPTSEAFAAWLRFQHYSKNTVRQRRYHVERALRLGLTRDTGTEQLAELFDPAWGLEQARLFRFSLVLFFRWQGVEPNPAVRLSKPKPKPGIPRPFSHEEVVRYLTAALALGGRYTVLAFLGVYGGLRVHEAAKLSWGDVTSRMLVVCGKGGITRHVPLNAELARVLDAWRVECRSKRWVFPSSKSDQHVGGDCAGRLHTRIIEAAGLRTGDPRRDGFHRTRHTAATALLRASRDLRKVQVFLGHRSPTTTAVYTLVDDDELYDAVNSVHF